MKTLLLIFLPLFSFSQPVIGTGIGYSSLKKYVYNLQVGYQLGRSLVNYDQRVPLTNNSNSPIVLCIKYGYNISSFQPNIGISDHISSSDKINEKTNFHLSYGITKYFKFAPLKFDVVCSGNYLTFCIVVYKIIK